MHTFDLDAIAAGLPAAALIPQLSELQTSRSGHPGPGGTAATAGLRAVITAPPGTGNTTCHV